MGERGHGGAGGVIGAQVVAKSAPDGYTVGGFNDSIMTMLPSFHSKMPWDILKDFEPVSLVATIEWALVVAAGAGATPRSTSKCASVTEGNLSW